MKLNSIFQLPFVVFKKIINKLFFLTEKRNRQLNVHLETGTDCSIHYSVILSTSQNGVIKLGGGNYIGRNVEISTTGRVELGRNASIQDRCIILGDVDIGAYCVFATNVYVSSGRHYFNHIPEYYIQDQDKIIQTDPDLKKAHSKKVVIEDDCWIGANVVIMSGLVIGKGCVIGSNSVVTKSIPPYTVAAGSPAKPINQRLDFKPKKDLLYTKVADLPYFYKGFFTDKLNIDYTKPKGGIAALANFVICADGSNASKLVLNLKKLTNYPLSINYNQQAVLITANEFENVSFNIADTVYHQFIITSANGEPMLFDKVVYVKQVSVY